MIITVACDVLGEENNGTTIAAKNLIRHLQSQGHTVRILCPEQSKKGIENYYVVPKKSFGKFIDSLIDRVGVTLAKPDKNIILESLKGADHVHIMVPLGLGRATAKMAKELNISITAGFHMQAENLTCYFGLKSFTL